MKVIKKELVMDEEVSIGKGRDPRGGVGGEGGGWSWTKR